MEFSEKISRERAVNMNPVVLAFIGDAVQTLFVRQRVAYESDCKSGMLNEKTAKIVRAESQAALADRIFSELTEEEAEIFRRARNAKKPSHAKHAKISEYNKSTGIEAVIGYLYVIGETERLNYILNFDRSET